MPLTPSTFMAGSMSARPNADWDATAFGLPGWLLLLNRSAIAQCSASSSMPAVTVSCRRLRRVKIMCAHAKSSMSQAGCRAPCSCRSLGWNDLGDAGVRVVVGKWHAFSSLRVLGLVPRGARRRFSRESARCPLASQTQCLSTVCRVGCGRHRLGRNNITPDGAYAVAAAVAGFLSLQTVL